MKVAAKRSVRILRMAVLALIVGLVAGQVVQSAIAEEEPTGYPPGCKPPVAFVSLNLAEHADGLPTAMEALPSEVLEDVRQSGTTTPEGDVTFETPEGELFIVTRLGDGFALATMRVCGGQVGEGVKE
jgi:hypothetical protein